METSPHLLHFFSLSQHFFFLSGDIQERFDFSEQPPPLPIPQLHPRPSVPLDHSYSGQLLDALLVVPPCDISSTVRLEDCDDLSELNISLFFKMSEHSCTEEDLRLTDTVQVRIHLKTIDLKEEEGVKYRHNTSPDSQFRRR